MKEFLNIYIYPHEEGDVW